MADDGGGGRGTTSGPGRADLVRCWAAFASLGAGLIHLAVVQEHFSEWWLYGVFFAGLGALQVLWAVVALARDEPPFRALYALATLGVIVLWVVTRTTGLPVGPEPWTAEAVGRADVLCTVLELAVVGLLLALPRVAADQPAPTRGRSARFVALMFAGAVAVAAVTTPALAATPAGGQAEEHGHMGDH